MDKRGGESEINIIDCNSCLDTLRSSKDNLRKYVEIEFFNFCEKLMDYQEDFENIIKFVTNIDVLICKASIAEKYNYCKPLIDDDKEDSYIHAKQMRHLLIEQINQQEIYVPNDIKLDNNELVFYYYTNAMVNVFKSIGICVILHRRPTYLVRSLFTSRLHKFLHVFWETIF